MLENHKQHCVHLVLYDTLLSNIGSLVYFLKFSCIIKDSWYVKHLNGCLWQDIPNNKEQTPKYMA